KKHHTPLHEVMYRFKLKPELMQKIAAMRQGPKWKPAMAIRIADNKDIAKEEDRTDIARIKVYSDGSGLEGQVGVAAVLYHDGILRSSRRLKLGSLKHHTVFKGEGVGMILRLELIREEQRVSGRVPMGVDNTAAIITMQAIKPSPSHHIWDLFHRRLNMVANRHKDMNLLVRWTPGHVDIEGNEEADRAAKAAITIGSSPNNKLPAPQEKLYHAVNPQSDKLIMPRSNARLHNYGPNRQDLPE
ncbi:hypothetical protein BYT27DRAFT_7106622, partial [Phlegmacium glaucopus]